MKKGFSALFFAIMAIAMLVSNVRAAPGGSNRNATLKSVTYGRGGIVLLFHTSGLSKHDLKNISFVAHSIQYGIDCRFVGQTSNVRCTVSKRLSMFSGESFHGTIAGLYFEGKLPAARIFSPVVKNTDVATETLVGTDSQVVTETLAVTDNPDETNTPAVVDTLIETDTPAVTEISTGCPAGQTLVYDYEWSGTAHSSGYITSSTTYYNAAAFYAEYSSYYDYVSTTDTAEGTLYSYYLDNTYTFTSSGSIDSSQWDWYVEHMDSLGYAVEQTGEHCE